MDQGDVQRWLDRYVEAWRANEPKPIEELFSDDVVYRYRPYGDDEHVSRGLADVVAVWLGETMDEPDSWEAAYSVFAVDGDRAVATGTSRYYPTDAEPERVYHNCFVMRFAPDGTCREFTEYYMLQDQ